MAKRQFRTLNKRMVDRLSVDGKDAVFWDRGLPGFGVRVYRTGAKVFVVQTYAFGRSKRVTLGRYGPKYFVDHAREDAKQAIARIKAGESPVPSAALAEPTVRDLADRYQREYVAMHCKPVTATHYGVMLRKHIVPGLGDLRVGEVERKHIMELQYGLSEMPTVANRAVDILVKMFNLEHSFQFSPI